VAPRDQEKNALSLLFRYSLLNKKAEDSISQTSLLSHSQNTDRQLLDQILESIDRHDSQVVQKI
jgi:hypothetical protein